MKSVFQILYRRVSNPHFLLDYLICKIGPILPDKFFLQLRFYIKIGHRLNLMNPKTFNEKLQWLKLYNRRPEFTMMVDKAKVKQYVAGIIGEEHIIPTLATYENAEDINFDELPNSFVLKCTHDSGGIVICQDKSKLDQEAAIRKLNKALKTHFFYINREWPYKNVKPRIIAEQYMSDDGCDELTDYKVHNFNGTPRLILVCRNRYKESGLTEDFYSCKWEHLDISRPAHKQANEPIACPQKLDEILRMSKMLSKNNPFIRTDFYLIDSKVYFGELTFYPASGFQTFVPDEWNYILGSWLDLPFKNII